MTIGQNGFRASFAVAFGLAAIAAGACGRPEKSEPAGGQRPEGVSALLEPLPAAAPQPADNPGTFARVELGHKLFFEPVLSRSRVISCNSCHVVGAAGIDGRDVAIGEGARTGPRNSPTVFNAAFLASQFWDGRAPTLEEQAKGPIQAHVEMDLTPAEAVDRLLEVGYAPLFEAAFPGEAGPLTFDNVARAIAAFERTLVTPGAPFDRYLAGDTSALSPAARRGLALFQGAGCIGCHNGVMVGGGQFAAFTHVKGADIGRAGVTSRAEDRYVFRVAPLRNVAVTAPYFHNGSAATLHDAITIMGRVQLQRTFNEAEAADVAAYLESLTGEFPVIAYPKLPRRVPVGPSFRH